MHDVMSPRQKNPSTRGPSTCAIQTVIPVLKERYFIAETPPIVQEANEAKPASVASLSDAILNSY